MSITNTPPTVPCGGTGTITQTSAETSKSWEGNSLEAGKLYDQALKFAFMHAQHSAFEHAKCSGGCHPWVDNVSVSIKSVSYEQQILWTFLSWELQYKCVMEYTWTATFSCNEQRMPVFASAGRTIA